jgi:hypothetical protein
MVARFEAQKSFPLTFATAWEKAHIHFNFEKDTIILDNRMDLKSRQYGFKHESRDPDRSSTTLSIIGTRYEGEDRYSQVCRLNRDI